MQTNSLESCLIILSNTGADKDPAHTRIVEVKQGGRVYYVLENQLTEDLGGTKKVLSVKEVSDLLTANLLKDQYKNSPELPLLSRGFNKLLLKNWEVVKQMSNAPNSDELWKTFTEELELSSKLNKLFEAKLIEYFPIILRTLGLPPMPAFPEEPKPAEKVESKAEGKGDFKQSRADFVEGEQDLLAFLNSGEKVDLETLELAYEVAEKYKEKSKESGSEADLKKAFKYSQIATQNSYEMFEAAPERGGVKDRIKSMYNLFQGQNLYIQYLMTKKDEPTKSWLFLISAAELNYKDAVAEFEVLDNNGKDNHL